MGRNDLYPNGSVKELMKVKIFKNDKKYKKSVFILLLLVSTVNVCL